MELLGGYSNRSDLISKLTTILSFEPVKHSEQVKHSPTKRARQLTPAQTQQLIARYQAGETVYDLSAAFQIHRTTVGVILKRENVASRWRRLDDRAIARAIDLYRSGLSEAAVAGEFNVSSSTIHNVLKRQGVERRSVGTNQWRTA